MVRRFLLSGLCLALAFTKSNAQADFTLSHHTVSDTTEGSATSNWDVDAIQMHNYMHNNTNATLIINWQLLSKSFPSSDWFIYGLCDNMLCRSQTSPALIAFAPQATNDIAVGDSSLIEPRVAVPASGANGIGVIKVKVWTDNTVDTATYILVKNGTTGVSTISMHDTKVYLSPNPASDKLMVYTDNSLHAARLVIYDITGKQQSLTAIQQGNEIVNLNIANFASGMYFIRLTDDKGKVITTRKFTKK